jgi:predicted Zn-dependent protease
MATAAGETAPHRLEFRASPVIGPNAFALPSGIIVVTDELVKLSRNDREVLAVLAHELGHVRYRHTMRHLLQGSATALIIAGVTGDIASTTSLAAAAPALLLQTKYSRDYEREADRYAIELLQKAGIGPSHFAAILARMENKPGKPGALPTFLSSHPPTQERKALALASAGASAQAQDDEQTVDERAFQDYLAAAKLNDSSAQLQVGKFYWSGTGVKQDREEALVWLRKSAEQGNTDAKVSLDEAQKELAGKPQ